MDGDSPFRVRPARAADAEAIAAVNLAAGRAGWIAFLDLAGFEPRPSAGER